MKKLFATTAVALLLAAPAFATEKPAQPTTRQLNQQQVNLLQQAAARAQAEADALAAAAANAKATGGAANAGAIAGGGDGGNSGGNTLDGGDNKTEMYAISYTDAAPPTVAASIGDGVVVTTWGVKVLGPIFGMTDQHVHYTPAATAEAADLSYRTRVNDGTFEDEQRQLAAIDAVCAHDQALARQRKLVCE